MTHRILGLALLIAALLCSACTSDPIEHCDTIGAVTPLCGVQMPEDIEPLPNNGGLIVAEFGDFGKISGKLQWYQPGSDARFHVLVDTQDIDTGASNERWGEANCKIPDLLSPHGIHLSNRGDALQLLVVNHSSLEQVLFYEVTPAADAKKAPTLSWRGCVTFPEEAMLNDVAALPDGGFAVTHMFKRGTLAEVGSIIGWNKGHVWRWNPDSGIQALPNTKAKMPNGISVAADGKSLWINNYLSHELAHYDLDSAQVTKRISVPNIDNSAWLDEQHLLLASHISPLRMASCYGVRKGSCASPYELVEVNVETGETRVVFASSTGEPFGPATVAVPYQGSLYAGSFNGDRMARIVIQP